MSIFEKKQCPVCGEALLKNIHEDNRSIIYVDCPACGKFALSHVFYEDYILNSEAKKQKAAAFLKAHSTDALNPCLCNLMAPVPDGYRCFPACRIR